MAELLEVIAGIIDLLWNGFLTGFDVLTSAVSSFSVVLSSFPVLISSCLLCVIAVAILMRVV